jgi:hypothetical protein
MENVRFRDYPAPRCIERTATNRLAVNTQCRRCHRMLKSNKSRQVGLCRPCQLGVVGMPHGDKSHVRGEEWAKS